MRVHFVNTTLAEPARSNAQAGVDKPPLPPYSAPRANVSWRYAVSSPAYTFRAAAFAALLVSCLTGCVVTMQPPVVTAQAPAYAEVVVAQAPPPPRQEVVVQAPSPSHVWVPGRWDWQGQWIWTPGYWIVRPQPYAVWTPGHWQPHGYGWVWSPGYWR